MLPSDIYAVKKRKKPVQKHKPAPDVTKSNPSKRHRDRLNGELDRLTSMLPFPEDVRSRLDKLSVLRLSVGYLKVKSFFNATMRKNNLEFPIGNGPDMNEDTTGLSEGELLLQALSGFVLVVTAEGYVFYASQTIQDYLGFHQSDVLHQSAFEFIHVDDRAMFRRQLHFALNPKLSDADQEDDEGLQSSSDITRNIVTYDPQHIPPENSSFLERSFVCRFRCLLDNSSGFLKLNFQGRLKFLLGQNKKAEDGSLVQPQLALFAIATPVQQPAILEIRTKTLFFQTRHKLDFTPLGIDSRGKIVLGYSEIELCMKGSGYQFIHAADLMHCADNHLRMIKTGESGMTVFRLLTKNGGWVWVQANARLIYKGGRPDFIIARQRALVNAEGEEHLRRRSLQLPFSLTTGEAVLYDTSPTGDMMSPESHDLQPLPDQKPLNSNSVHAVLLSQDRSLYQQPTEPEITVDDAFKDSWALFNVPSHTLLDETMKEEQEDSVASMIDTLEQLTQDGDICSALQHIEVDSTELKEWENALLRMAKESSSNGKTLSLDEIITNDIFSYVEDALYEEINKNPLPQPNAPTAAKNYPFEHSGHFETFSSNVGHSGCGFPVNHSFDNKGVPRLDFNGLAKQEMLITPDNSQRLLHSGPNGLPGHQLNTSFQNVLNNHSEQNGIYTCGNKDSDFFNQKRKCLGEKPTPGAYIIPANGWEPQHSIHDFRDNAKVPASVMSSCQFGSFPLNQTENPQLHHSQNGFHQPSQPPINHWSQTALSAGNHSPSLSPCKTHLSSDGSPSCPDLSKFSQQGQIQPLPGHVKNRPVPESFQSLVTPGFPLVDLQPETSHLAPSHSSPLSSCMFESRSQLGTNVDQLHPQAQAVTISSYCKNTVPHNQSPPQASCYFQWTGNEPVVGTSSIPQEHVCVSPPSRHILPGVTPTDSLSVFQQYQGCNGHTQVESHPEEHSSSFSVPPLLNGIYLPENSTANCCDL